MLLLIFSKAFLLLIIFLLFWRRKNANNIRKEPGLKKSSYGSREDWLSLLFDLEALFLLFGCAVLAWRCGGCILICGVARRCVLEICDREWGGRGVEVWLARQTDVDCCFSLASLYFLRNKIALKSTCFLADAGVFLGLLCTFLLEKTLLFIVKVR